MVVVGKSLNGLKGIGLVLVILCVSLFSKPAQAQWADTCQHLRLWGVYHPTDSAYCKLQYDTLRLYIEHCATSDKTSWSYLRDIVGAVWYMSNDVNRFDSCRKWLISVLYLNRVQEEYFCACMGAIYSTYQSGKYSVVGSLAVMDWLRKNHHECWDSGDDVGYSEDSTAAAQGGYDVIHLPPLDSLGLGFLLKASVPSPTNDATSYLSSFTSSPNPFKTETHLRFHLNQVAYVTIGIYDVLGYQVWGDEKGKSFEAGEHEITIDGSSLPQGPLYARISTGVGEVKTVKLVKE